MKKIAVVTATRAEYGLLTPLIKRIIKDEELELDLIVTGTHLSDKYGHTIDAIIEDGFPIAHKIDILDDDNSPYGISLTMANSIRGFAKCFKDDRPDMVVILGDRTEMLGVASAAMNARVPIAHIHGGEVTEGAVDDCVRHAISKMSYLHFTSTEVYKKRVIQLGESPDRVFNVGALGTENILTQKVMDEDVIKLEAGVPLKSKYAIVTFHPATVENNTAERQAQELCKAMNLRYDIFFLITGANADTGGDIINRIFHKYAETHDNAKFICSLGMQRYISAMKHALLVMGNSSSGILEAPVLGVPTVNIGDRQKGRLLADTVVNCLPEHEDILKAVSTAEKVKRRPSGLFGDGNTSYMIIKIIRKFLFSDQINLKKGFYDLSH